MENIIQNDLKIIKWPFVLDTLYRQVRLVFCDLLSKRKGLLFHSFSPHNNQKILYVFEFCILVYRLTCIIERIYGQPHSWNISQVKYISIKNCFNHQICDRRRWVSCLLKLLKYYRVQWAIRTKNIMVLTAAIRLKY